jgi:hypothetical protein
VPGHQLVDAALGPAVDEAPQHVAEVALRVDAVGDNGAIYAIRQNGEMLFYKHAGANDGSAEWPIQAKQIGHGWDFQQVFAG